MLKVASTEGSGRVEVAIDGSPIDEIVREGARAMLAAALHAEVAAYIEAHAHEVDEDGRRLVVRNGYAQPRGSSGPRMRDQGSGTTAQFLDGLRKMWRRSVESGVMALENHPRPQGRMTHP